MAFRLSDDEQAQRDKLLAGLVDVEEKLKEAVEQFNTTMKAAWENVAVTQDQYNKLIIKAQDFVGGVHEKYEALYDKKSEKWQDGDEGQAVYNWLEEWSNMLEDSDLEMPEPIELLDADPALDDLPIEPSK